MKNLVYHHIFIFIFIYFFFLHFIHFLSFGLCIDLFHSFNFALFCVLNALTYIRSACNPSFHKNNKKKLRYNTHNNAHGYTWGPIPMRCTIAITTIAFHGLLKLFFSFTLPRSDHWIHADWPPIDLNRSEENQKIFISKPIGDHLAYNRRN